MKISILTPSFNQAKFLTMCINSIHEQKINFHELEHIIIDGGSNDDTIKVLINSKHNLTWISEKDEGQSDALIKGLNLATGEIIGWLNSDDYYLDGTLIKVMSIFEKQPEVEWIVGYCKIVDENNKEIKKWLTKYKNFFLNYFNFNFFLFEDYISQPAVFMRKSLIKECGWIDKELHYAMDYDLWLRFAMKSKPFVVREYLSGFRRHDTSKSETSFDIQFKEADFVTDRYTNNLLIKFLKKMNMKKNILLYKILMK